MAFPPTQGVITTNGGFFPGQFPVPRTNTTRGVLPSPTTPPANTPNPASFIVVTDQETTTAIIVSAIIVSVVIVVVVLILGVCICRRCIAKRSESSKDDFRTKEPNPEIKTQAAVPNMQIQNKANMKNRPLPPINNETRPALNNQTHSVITEQASYDYIDKYEILSRDRDGQLKTYDQLSNPRVYLDIIG